MNKYVTDKHQALSWIRLHQYPGQPLNSFKPATSGHASSLSYTPSPWYHPFPPNFEVRPYVEENEWSFHYLSISKPGFLGSLRNTNVSDRALIQLPV
jgi:hypothetical protein